MNSDYTMSAYAKLESLSASNEQWKKRTAFLDRLDSFAETIVDSSTRRLLKTLAAEERLSVEKESFKIDLRLKGHLEMYEQGVKGDRNNEKAMEEGK